jgi:hypothetical protein
MTEHPHDDIEAFALGALDGLSAQRVLAHADACPTCAVLLAEAMHNTDALEPTRERALKTEIDIAKAACVAGHSVEPQRRLSRWAVPAALAAAVVALLVWNLNLSLRSTQLVVPVASLVHSHFEHHALRGAVGSAKVLQALDGIWLYLVADGLTPRSRYQLWEKSEGTTHEVGTFTTDAGGVATAYWGQKPQKVASFVVARSADEATSGGGLRWP